MSHIFQVPASHRVDRRAGSAHLDLCRGLPAEEVEQQLAGRSGDADGIGSLAVPNGPAVPAHRSSRPRRAVAARGTGALG